MSRPETLTETGEHIAELLFNLVQQRGALW